MLEARLLSFPSLTLEVVSPLTFWKAYISTQRYTALSHTCQTRDLLEYHSQLVNDRDLKLALQDLGKYGELCLPSTASHALGPTLECGSIADTFLCV